MSSRAALALVLASATAAAGCEFLAAVDRGEIGHDAGGGGAPATTASTGGAPTTTTGSAGDAGDAGDAGGAPCIYPFDCPGADSDCEKRTCTAGRCGTAPVAAGTPTSTQVAGDCMRQVCDGMGGAKLVVDDLDVPDDGNPCTDDLCVTGTPSHAPSAALTPCDQGGGTVCDGATHCVACVSSAECAAGTCVNNACVSAMCIDGIKDGAETDVDCGGPVCPRCAAGKACAVAADCVSAVCSGAPAACQPPSCIDKVKNGTETDVDCGGGCPEGCGPGKGCAVDGDCVGGACSGGVCLPSCTDGVQNGTETGVDCGGGCPPCAVGLGCGVGADCASGVCIGGVCLALPASCSDGALDGTETDVDCGGPGCPPCAVGEACLAARDCSSGRCAGGVCAPRILISQVRSRGAGGASDELVELYNPDVAKVTLDAGWTLSTRTAIGTCDGDGARLLFTGAGQVIPARGHLLIAGMAYAELPLPDAVLAIGGVPDAASVVLSQGAVVVDALCFAYDAATLANLAGCATPYVCEGAPASNLPHDNTESAASTVDASLLRRPGGALGNGMDTGVSSADFRVISPAKPESSTSPPAVP